MDEPNACQLCVDKASRYTCPRCNVRYCSVECYRGDKHLSCSEAFYKDCVIEGLKDQTTRPEERQKVLEMLQRLDDEVPALHSDDDDVEDLEDRVGDLDLDRDSDEVWRRLTDHERSEFKAMLRDGRLSNLVKSWTPWWTYKDESLVHEVGAAVDERLSQVPAEMPGLPDVDEMLKNKRPSVNLKNNILNVLYSYAYIVRLYNGGHWDNPTDAASELLDLCDVLSSNKNYESPQDAIHACVHHLTATKTAVESNRHFHISVIRDVCDIIQGPGQASPLKYCMACLSDLHRLLGALINDIKTKNKKGKCDVLKGDKRDQLKLTYLAHKKLEFLLSWCRRYGMALHSTIAVLNLEICGMTSDLSSVETTKSRVEETWRQTQENEDKPPLIVELS